LLIVGISANVRCTRLAICQGFLEKNRADTKDISSQDLIKAIDDLGKLAQSDKPQFSRVG